MYLHKLIFFSSSFLKVRGPGGWSMPPLRPHDPKPKYRTPSHPRLPRRGLLAMTGVRGGAARDHRRASSQGVVGNEKRGWPAIPSDAFASRAVYGIATLV